MADWRRTAAEVSANTITHTTTKTQAIQDIETVRGHYAKAAEVCARFRQGLQYQAHAGDALPHLPTAMGRLSRAVIGTRRLSAFHAGSGHVFSLCTARLGLQDAEPASWQRWRAHHADTAAHAAMALQRLFSAMSHGAAAIGAILVMLGTAPTRPSHVGPEHAAYHLVDNAAHYNIDLVPPPQEGFPLWDSWGHAAEQLLRRVADELAMARAALEQMHPAAVAEYYEAWAMLVPPTDVDP